MTDKVYNQKKLLITVVNKGLASKVVEASKAAGCEGGTILPGKGTSIKEKNIFFGLTFDPEKEVIFSVVDSDSAHEILHSICEEGNLNEPGNGIAFVVNISKIAGIAHLIDEI